MNVQIPGWKWFPLLKGETPPSRAKRGDRDPRRAQRSERSERRDARKKINKINGSEQRDAVALLF